MTVNLSKSRDMYESAAMRGRVRAALFATAVSVLQETPPADAETHERRQRLARLVIRDPETAMLNTFVAVVANDDETTALADPMSVTDARIGQIVSGAFTRIARALTL